jgi:hypothetical protein
MSSDAAAPSPPRKRRAKAADGAARAVTVRKPVNTLAIVPKSARITSLGRKSYNVLLHEAQAQGLDKDVFRAPLERIVRGVDFDSNDHALIKKHLRAMVSTTVEWQSPTTGEGTAWNISGLLAHARLTKERGQVWVEWSYAVNLKQELLEPSVFARLKLEIISQLRSHAGIALYEICTRYKDVGRTSRQHWRWWRPVLTGQQDDPGRKPPEYRYFKRDVLTPAITEINALSDIDVRGPVEHKGADNKTIEQIQFAVLPKPARRPPGAAPAARVEPVDLPLIGRAIDAGVKQEEAERLLQDFGAPALASGLDGLQRRTALPPGLADPVQNPARYLRAVLPNALTPGVEPATPATPAAPARPRPAAPAADAPRRQARWLDAWLRRAREALRQEILALPEDTRAQWLRQFRAHLAEKRSALLKRFDSSGWTHALFVQDFIRFYGNGTRGPGWDKPSAEQLLELAAEIGDSNA